MPDESILTKDFIKAVFAGQKQLLKKVDVVTIEVPHYEELSVKNIYPSMRKDGQFQQYFPDKYPKGKIHQYKGKQHSHRY